MISLRKKGLIGVDIGTRSVKVAQVARSGEQWKLVDTAIINRPEPWDFASLSESLPSSEAEIASAVSLARKLSGRRCALAASSSVCQSAMTDQATNGDVAKEKLDQLFQIGNRRELSVDYITSHGENPDTAHVMAFGIPTEWAQQLTSNAKQAGLNCEVLDAIPLALSRAIQYDRTVPGGAVVVAIDWGYSEATICVCRDGHALFTRSLNRCGARHVLRALADSLSLSEGELCNAIFPSADCGEELRIAVSQIIRPAVTELANEARKTIGFFFGEQAEMPEQVRLFGGGAMIPGVAVIMEEVLSIPVELWSMPCEEQTEHELPIFGATIALSTLSLEGAK